MSGTYRRNGDRPRAAVSGCVCSDRGLTSGGWVALPEAMTAKLSSQLRGRRRTTAHIGGLGISNFDRERTSAHTNSNQTTFAYDANSNLTTETLPAGTGVVDTFTFNASDQLGAVASNKGGSALFSASYARDAANQLTSDSSAISGTGSYRYSPLSEVCYAGSSNANACSSPPTGSIAYTYDAADNLTQKGSVQQTFNNADELCWTASTSGSCGTPPSGSTTYQYDSRGNRTNVNPSGGQAQTLTYDQANRLTKYAAASATGYG